MCVGVWWFFLSLVSFRCCCCRCCYCFGKRNLPLHRVNFNVIVDAIVSLLPVLLQCYYCFGLFTKRNFQHFFSLQLGPAQRWIHTYKTVRRTVGKTINYSQWCTSKVASIPMSSFFRFDFLNKNPYTHMQVCRERTEIDRVNETQNWSKWL